MNENQKNLEALTLTAPIELDDIEHVYSGIDGRCCCGCSGKHSYRHQYVALGSMHRGYPVQDYEISERMARKVAKIINSDLGSVEIVDLGSDTGDVKNDRGPILSVVIGQRLYIAYMVIGAKVSVS